MIFRRFPYTTLNDLNLDWIIKQVKQIAAALQGKQDKPDAAGAAGQVLGLDENLDPVWLDQSGGGGTNNYNNLTNKPQINSVTLSGNKTAADLGLATPGDIPVQSVNGHTGAVELDAADVGALPNNTFIPGYSLQLPLMDGEASAGTTYARYSMEGHVHPTDTSRASAAELATFTRPNLLVNPIFVGGGSQLGYGVFPINQRGQGSYYANNEYTIDRWMLRTVGGSCAVGSDGITISGGTDTQAFVQTIMDGGKSLRGKTVTLSARIISKGSETVLIRMGNATTPLAVGTIIGQAEANVGIASVTVDVPSVLTNPYFNVMLSTSSGGSFTVAAMKLEIGPDQTLAHQENGDWVLNEIPDYATELAKCQTYLFPIDANYVFRCSYFSANRIDFSISLPSAMAKNPVFQSADFVLVSLPNISIVSGASFRVVGAGPLIRISADLTAHGLTDAAMYSNTKWYLSAE